MAIQFPNFLAAQTHAPDYSGIGDVFENFYKGYNMPKDALIKEIQAKFAQPNAEADLKSTHLRNTYQEILNQFAPESNRQSILSSKLGNRKSQIDIDKAVMELEEQRQLQNQLRQALSGGSSQGTTSPPMGVTSPPQPVEMPPLMPSPQTMGQGAPEAPLLPGMPSGMPMPPRVGGMTMVGSPPLMPNGTGAPNAPMAPSPEGIAPNAPVAPATQPEPLNEVVITKGSPHLAGVDAMYESNPLSRSFLEKKGYKKSQKIEFDKKTGKTTIITKYPSGKVTVQASPGAGASENGIPLTSKMVSKHQNIISSIDNAEPVIKKIIDEKGFQPYPRSLGMGLVPGWMGQSSTYESLVKGALDSLIGAYGLPMTNEGINTVKDQLLIGHGETAAHYRHRLRDLLTDLQRRKSYSENEVKKSNKISPVNATDSKSDEDSYSSNDWEPA